MTIRDIIIIGGGPAALTAGIYCARAKLDTLIFEGFLANGISAGGQLTTTTVVENFPAFPDGITGPELCQRFREQSLNMGCKINTETVKRIDISRRPFKVFTEDNTIYETRSIIIATGSTPKKLTFMGSEEFWNKGIGTCAVCDGSLPIFRNKPIAVVGGGNTAFEEAIYMTKYASVVYLIHRRDEFRGSKIMEERVKNNPKIQLIMNSEIVKASGGNLIKNLVVRNNKTKNETIINVNGLFMAIGHTPSTTFLDNQIDLDQYGYIITDPYSTKTSVEGIFAAGDCADYKYRQAIVAAGQGCMAALDVETYLEDKNDETW